MEVFAQAIFNTLARRQRVILPGVGTLYTQQTAAEVDRAGTVSAPRTTLRFTVREEAGETLPESLAVRSGLPLKDIRQQYNRWVAGLRKQAGDGNLRIEGVVALTRQPDGEYRAEPSEALARRLNPMEQQKIQLPVVPPVKAAKTSPEKKSAPEKKKATTAPSPARPAKRRKTGWIALPAALLLLGGGGYYAYTQGWLDGIFPSPKPSPAPHEPVRPTVETPAVLPDTLPADSVQTAPEPIAPEVITPEPTLLSTPAGTLPDGHTGPVYHVIAGVFSTQDNAERCIRQNGFDPARATIIPTANGKFMVSTARFADKASADAEMARLQKTVPQAWVSKRRK